MRVSIAVTVTNDCHEYSYSMTQLYNTAHNLCKQSAQYQQVGAGEVDHRAVFEVPAQEVHEPQRVQIR